MSQYLTVEEYRGFSIVPSLLIDQLQANDSDWLTNQLVICSGEIDSRLSKRYVTPFTQLPVPNQLKIWLSKLVDIRAYLHLGVEANDRQVDMIQENEVLAKTEMKEAADAVNGLFDLPLIQDQQGSGIARPRVMTTSQSSPYAWIAQQADRASRGV